MPVSKSKIYSTRQLGQTINFFMPGDAALQACPLPSVRHSNLVSQEFSRSASCPCSLCFEAFGHAKIRMDISGQSIDWLELFENIGISGQPWSQVYAVA